MAHIYDTDHFILESHEKPEVDRLEWGHIKITPKEVVEDRSKLMPEQAVELMRLTIIAWEALKIAMSEVGVDIARINYQDNGNWSPRLHVHLYWRAKDATVQKFWDPITPGHKASYHPLNSEDMTRIQYAIDSLTKTKKFSEKDWKLTSNNE